ncbi:unnamed protein product [Staurois parvus]|uniref:Uncharacterized protein n=1 Tax=Staurois parvus TaxID=386267 RepID=A0ABN9F515_9NEOB|nr:unnamed protein product [Staurois parvus]
MTQQITESALIIRALMMSTHQCHSPVPSSASHQCPEVLPIIAAQQCPEVLPNSAQQCHQSVPPVSPAS